MFWCLSTHGKFEPSVITAFPAEAALSVMLAMVNRLHGLVVRGAEGNRQDLPIEGRSAVPEGS
jgi:hypothetical protein